MSIKIKYNLGTHGWADVRLSSGLRRATISVSYLHDTLADLIGAANLLLKGAPEAKVLLMDEPGEHLVYLRAIDKAHVAVEARWFKDWASWNFVTEKDYKVVFSNEDTISSFSTQILENAERLLSKYGMDGYKARWIEHDFPMDEYNRLKVLLKR
jgi:hypothetical protein